MARWRHLKICNGVADQKDENISDFEDTGNGLLCKLCNVLMKHKSNTYRHRKTCKGSNLPKSVIKPLYPCPACQKVFNYKSKLEEHFVIHEKHYHCCTKCDHRFKRKDHYEAHMKKCNAVIPTFVNITSHRTVHFNIHENN